MISWRQFVLWSLLGIIGGIIAGVYWLGLEFLIHQFSFINGILIIPLMVLSGFCAGLIIHYLGNPGEIELIVNNIRFNGGRLNPKNNPSMILSSLLCIASGGSAGPEAPLVQVTGSTGSWIAGKLKLKGEDFRSMTLAGMASGFTSLFGAPLGGSLFALEILHHKYVVEYYQALIPTFISSCFSYIVFVLITHIGIGPTWLFPVGSEVGIADFGYAVLFAAGAAVLGRIFIYLFKWSKSAFSAFKVPIYIKMATGGLILGILSYYFPITRYFSHDQLSDLLSNEFTAQMLMIILVVKIAAIIITVTSGWRGGFIIPLFFCGAVLGLLLNHYFPEVNSALIMVSCMASLNACITRTPISTIILLSTMTGFNLLIPIMFAALTGFFLAPRIPLITSQLDDVKHRHDLQ